jgi:Tol biopolymer transport system component
MQRITSDPGSDISPVWSPDGSRIGWLHMGNQQAAILEVAAAGGAPRKIADVFPIRVDVVGRHLDWSPDGAWLAVTDKNSPEQPFRIVRIGVQDGSKRDLTLPPEQIIGDVSPAFSRDGKWLSFLRAVSSGVSDIYVVPAAGGPAQRVTFDNRYIVALAWTPDDRSIVFSSERGGNAALWQVPATGGTPARLPLVGPNASDPQFSRDGRKLVYSQVSEDANIWRRDASGRSTPVKLISSTQYDSSPQYSPDGSRVAFRSNRSGSHEIWVADNEGRNPTQITHSGGTLTGTPRWSPDGKEIAFDSRPEGQPDIYTIPAGGGKARRITSDRAEDVVPSWSQDGLWIYFASNRSGVWQVWRGPKSGGPAQQVTTLGGFAAFESPDGAYLYYAKGRDVAGLWRKRLPRGAEEMVLEDLKPGFWGYWAVVRDGIYFVDQPGAAGLPAIYFYEFAGKKRRLVASLDKPAVLADSAFAASADGKFLLYAQLDQRGSDILAVDYRAAKGKECTSGGPCK